MKIFIATIVLTFFMSIGLGLYAQDAYSEDKTLEEKTGHKMETADDAKTSPFDLQYIDTMTLHHKAAIDMAALVATNSENPELKLMAQKMIEQQTKENAQMASIRDSVYAGTKNAANMGMKGMKTSMEDMDMDKLKAAKGTDFDRLYIQMMTTHHQGGVVMATEALKQLSDKKLIELSNGIIAGQNAEIAKFKTLAAAMDSKK